MIRLLLTLALGASLLPAQLYPPAPGQKPLSWVTVTANPSGACVQTTQGQLNVVNGTAWACVTGNASLINGTWTQVSGASGGLADPGANGLVYRSALNVTRPGVIGDVPTGYPYANLSGAPTSVPPFSLHNGGWTNWVDPRQCDVVHMFCAAGTIATTTGTMAQGSNQLTVASAAGWTAGMGASVAGGIAGGSELGGEGNPAVSVLSIIGNVFTLSANCTRVGGVSGVTVNHEDSTAIIAALTSGFDVRLFTGNYNVTSRSVGADILTINTPIEFIGDGQGLSTIFKRSISGSVLRIGTPNFGLGNEGVLVSDFAIGMGSGFTASDGAGVYVASSGGAGTYVNSATVERVLMIGMCNGFYTGLGVNVDWFKDSRVYGTPSTACGNAGGVIGLNTPSPGGDIYFEGIQGSGVNGTIVIKQADTSSFKSVKLNGGDIRFDPVSDGVVFRLRFDDTSVEGQGGSPTCGINFINHRSDEISFRGGGVGLNYTNGICSAAQVTNLLVDGMKFYGMGGYGLSLGGASYGAVSNNAFPSTASGAINLFGSSIVTVNGNTARGTGTFVSTNAVANQVFLGSNNTNLPNSFGAGTLVTYSGYLRGTTGSIGGALTVGACDTGTATVTGATTSMLASASPVTYPGDGYVYQAYVSAADTVTVKLCGLIVGTPTSSAYNVSVSAN